MDPIKIGIVDDHGLFREGIKSILSTMPGIRVVLEASNGRELLEILEHNSPDILLLDLEMNDMNGKETFLAVRKKHPKIKIIILTMYKEDRMISYMMEMGVNGYLIKDTPRDEFEKAIRYVHENGFYFNDTVSKALLSGLKSKKSKPTIGNAIYLTSREHEILQLIAKEYTTAEISEKLFLSHKTVEGHRKNLISKFNVKNTAGLILKAVREKIIEV